MQSLFGTDGIRGNVTSPLFSDGSLTRIGRAIGIWATRRYGHRPTIIIGHDTRHSAQHIKNSLIAGCISLPIDILDAHIIPTPAAAHFLRNMSHVAVAIIISASHNPAEDNGIKLFDHAHGKLHPEDELEITTLYYEECLQEAQPIQGSVLSLHNAHVQYARHIRSEILQITPRQFQPTAYRIVLDVAHGATAHIATTLFEACGAKVTTIHNAPNGFNINEQCGSTSPKVLQDIVVREKADVGFAFDGDGDRVIAVNRHGHIKNGDDLLCILLDHPDYYRTATSLVGTIMTNSGLEHHIAKRNISLLRTPVGDRNIIEALNKNDLPLGGEPVGHIILRNHLFTGDGLLVALKILETLRLTHNWDMVTFDHYAHISQKIYVAARPNLAEEPFASIIQEAHNKVPQGRIIVRYSGTEPVLRVAVESQDMSHAKQECDTLVHILHRTFKELS